MPKVKVYLHFVWSTKNREPFLSTKELRDQTWRHIKENGLKKGIFIDVVNGYTDHCHCLISLGIDQDISTIMKLLKGESSFWINQQNFLPEKFEWQDEYFVVSVSESHVDAVRNYILNQEEHHQHKTFQQEYSEMIKKFGFSQFG
jgi:putative transposase